MKKPFRILSFIALCSLAIDMATFWLRIFDFFYCSLVAVPCYFLFVWGCCRHWRRIAPAKILLATLLGWSIPYIPLFFMGNIHSATPIDLFMHVAGMAGGYLFYKTRRRIGKVAVIGVSLALLAVEPTAIAAAAKYVDFGSIDGRIVPEAVEPIRAVGSTGDPVVLGDDPEKLYVLDCWNVRCGYCIKDLPDFQRLYDPYRHDARVVFCALDVGDTLDQVNELFGEEGMDGLDFPVAVCDKETARRLGVKVVPTYILIRNGQIVFRNDSQTLARRLNEFLER